MFAAETGGTYTIRSDRPQQVIKGLGFEIQSDSIGSGNAGMPDAVVAVPHDLTPDEKQRFYKEMLHGFRYSRLAMGLYLRGTDADKKHIVERYPGQMDDLRTMQQVTGIEGFDVEYWSPAPYWKQGMTYYGGSIRANDPEFLGAFSDAMVEDLQYLRAHGLRIAQWGLQNEPAIGLAKRTDEIGDPLDAKQAYGTCHYTPEDYAAALKMTVPKVRALLPDVHIHAPSWDGPAGAFAAEIRKDPKLLKNIDAWTWHQIGHNSNDQIDQQAKYMQGADGKPVYQNEFEYQPWDASKIDSPFMNTGQALMNWMVFENSPTWYWLHALKPVTNLEATGYSLGFWRPPGVLKENLRPNLKEGHWEFNPQNWNAIAGFLKYLPWDVGANLQRNAPSGTFNFAAGLTSDPSGAAPPAGFANSGNTYASFLVGAVSGASVVTNTGQTDRSFAHRFSFRMTGRPRIISPLTWVTATTSSSSRMNRTTVIVTSIRRCPRAGSRASCNMRMSADWVVILCRIATPISDHV